ncbi:MAG TPA: response regulator transcription factor [Chloroflexota bacterium]|nr:response regulator transcription factor [Chloroflexota bacterium]
MRILVVEDDREVAELLRRGLTQEQHIVDLAYDGIEGLRQAQQGNHDAIVLDVMLPGIDGLEVADRLRRQGNVTPILMLTARDALDDRLRGFDAGADDYLPKPFAFEELLARLRAITRRGQQVEDDRLIVGDLVLDRRAHEVTRAGKRLSLSPKEYALLEYLMRNQGQALSRTLILERVWDYSFDSFANVVDATIRRLRKAVDEGFDQQLIQTVRGVGYKIKA